MRAPQLSDELMCVMQAIKGVKIDNDDHELANEILRTTATVLGLKIELMMSRSRKRELSEARFIIVFLLKKYTNLKLKEISKLIGNRDHSTVIYCDEQAKDLLSSYPAFRNKLHLVEINLTI